MSHDTGQGYKTRLLFTLGLLKAMRPPALASLKLGQFQKIKLENNVVWKISGFIGSSTWDSKTASGGWNSISQSPTEVCVCNEEYADGNINFYKDIDDYMGLRTVVAPNLGRFFLAVDYRETEISVFQKPTAWKKLISEGCEDMLCK